MLIIQQIIILFFSAIAGYQDFHKREVSDILNYSFLLIAALLTIYIQAFTNFFYALLVFLLGYLLYKKGIIGGGDVKLLTAVTLTLPFLNSRFFLIDLVFLAVLLTSFSLLPNLFKYLKKKKSKAIKENLPNLFLAFLLLILLSATPFLFPILITKQNLILFLLLIPAIIYSGFEKEVRKMFYLKEVPIQNLDIDEIVDTQDLPKKYQNNFLTQKEFKELKKLGYKKLKVYRNLPPLVPFIFLAEIILFSLPFIF